MKKRFIFKKLILITMLLAIIISGCKKKLDDEKIVSCGNTLPTHFNATWNSAYDSYKFSQTPYKYYYYGTIGGSSDKEADIIDVCYEGNNNYIVLKMTLNNWDASQVGKYTVTKWKDLTSTQVKMSDAYNGTKPYVFSTSDLAIQNIIRVSTNEAEYFGLFGTYTKQ